MKWRIKNQMNRRGLVWSLNNYILDLLPTARKAADALSDDLYGDRKWHNLLSRITIRLDKLLLAHYLWSNKMLFSTQVTPVTFPEDRLENLTPPVFIQPIKLQSVTFKKHFLRRCVPKSILQMPAEITLAQLVRDGTRLRLMGSYATGFYQRRRAHARVSGYISICLEIFSPYAAILIHQIKDLSSLPYMLPLPSGFLHSNSLLLGAIMMFLETSHAVLIFIMPLLWHYEPHYKSLKFVCVNNAWRYCNEEFAPDSAPRRIRPTVLQKQHVRIWNTKSHRDWGDFDGSTLCSNNHIRN